MDFLHATAPNELRGIAIPRNYLRDTANRSDWINAIGYVISVLPSYLRYSFIIHLLSNTIPPRYLSYTIGYSVIIVRTSLHNRILDKCFAILLTI